MAENTAIAAPAPLLVDAKAAAWQLLTVKDVGGILKIHPRSVWRRSAEAEAGLSDFPKPLRLGPKTVRWRLSDVETYVDKLADGGRP